MFNAEYAGMYAEMKVGSRVVLDTRLETSMGDMHVTFERGEEGTIVCTHEDNADLEAGHRLWQVEFFRTPRQGSEDHYTYKVWFRAHKLGLIA